MAGRRTSLAALAGAKVEDVPGRSEPTLVRLALEAVLPTPLNPREDFGTPGELLELGQSMARGQLQPIVVVSRAGYLKLFPEHTDHVQGATYVIAAGERRYRGAREAGLESVEAVIREEVATSRKTFLDAVLSENIDRKNFDAIEEARAVEALVKEFGSARAVAEHRGKHEAWVSQRRSLLRLAPAAQRLVTAKKMPVEAARRLAKAVKDQGLDEQAQLEWWQAEQTRLVAQREKKRQANPADPTSPATAAPQAPRPAGQAAEPHGDFTAVKSPAVTPSVPQPASAGEVEPENFTAVKPPTGSGIPKQAIPRGATAAAEPAPRPAVRPPTPETQLVAAMPWGNPAEVLRIARDHMTDEDWRELRKLVLEHPS